MTGFNDPAAGAPTGDAQALLDLLAAASDVRDETRAAEQLATYAIVVAGIEAETLGYRERRLWSRDRDRGKSRCEQCVVVAVGSGVGQSDGDTGGVGKDRSFRPFLPRSVGFAPVISPPNGALLRAPSAAKKDQSMPTASS